MKLLSHRNVGVKKLALHCIATFKYNHTEHLRYLANDGFKATIIHFKVHKGSDIG